MKLIPSVASSLLVVLVAMPAFSGTTVNSNTPAGIEQSKQQVRFTDEQILGIIATVDEGEIAAANIAKTKQIMPKVSRYANYLLRQHSDNLASLKALEQKTGLKAMKSEQSDAMASDAAKEGEMLTSLNGKAFDAAYIDAMVKGHAGGLKLINTVLLKEVTNVQLKHFLVSFRALVTRHLEKAKKIQESM